MDQSLLPEKAPLVNFMYSGVTKAKVLLSHCHGSAVRGSVKIRSKP